MFKQTSGAMPTKHSTNDGRCRLRAHTQLAKVIATGGRQGPLRQRVHKLGLLRSHGRTETEGRGGSEGRDAPLATLHRSSITLLGAQLGSVTRASEGLRDTACTHV